MSTHYRIARDRFAGFEVQVWRWWWPFWIQPRLNTHYSIEKAEQWARHHAEGYGVAKYLGRLSGN